MESKTLPPIGYLIKQLDNLFTEGINEIHSSFGLTRTDWQVLNLINEKGQINTNQLTILIKPFARENSLKTILIKFKEDNLLREQTETLSLTKKGIKLHKACFGKQKVFREKAMINISPQQYQETIFTLQKLIYNLTT